MITFRIKYGSIYTLFIGSPLLIKGTENRKILAEREIIRIKSQTTSEILKNFTSKTGWQSLKFYIW